MLKIGGPGDRVGETTSMTQRKRHSSSEIAALLEQAETMAAQGQRQVDVCQSLGISVMTFHRWRKAHNQQMPAEAYPERSAADLAPQHRSTRIADLQVENARLRQLVTDLLLEKMRLEEAQ